ncbi:hypothetical protein Sjap_008015 [Stephania japonica]|uniref:Uncharacterized protein n=1 Tax=Stephania japonica TaxID=461633 RepID=A0AAP0JNP7_9MAGN
MEPIIDLNKPMEATIDLDSDHEGNYDCGSAKAMESTEIMGPTEDSCQAISVEDAFSVLGMLCLTSPLKH